MDALKRVEGFSEYAGVDDSCKKYEDSVDNLHKKCQMELALKTKELGLILQQIFVQRVRCQVV